MRYKLDPLSPNGISPEEEPKVIIQKSSNGYVSQGKDGVAGVGVPTGGTSGQILAKNSNTNYDTEWIDAGGIVDTDELVKLSAADPTAGYLDAKLQEGIQVVNYDTTPTLPTLAAGMTYFNTTEGTLSTKLSTEVTLDHGRELHFYGKASGNIANGDLCQYAGVQGDHILIKKAVAADVIANPFILIGVATENFTNGNFGRTTWFGKINGVYTDTPANQDDANWAAGDELFFSNTTGQLTKTAPVAPEIRVAVGYVVKTQTGAAENGIIEVAPSYGLRLQDLDDVNGTPLATSGQLPIWDNDNQYFDFTKNINDYRTYSGFENRTDSTIAINSGTGVFTLAKVSDPFNVWTNGTGKHVISDPQTVTVTDDQTITYIYIDSDGVLKKSTSPWDLDSGAKAPCAIVFKDSTSYTITDERHSYARNAQWHTWAHFNIGTMYRSGLVGTFANTTLSVTQGIIADEDIDFDTGGTKTSATLWYRNATNGMRMIRSSSTPYRAAAGVLQYDNGSGTLQPVDNAKFVNSWVYCSNDSTEPIYIVIGQNQYNTLNDARNASRPTINLSTAEWKLIYKATFHNANGTATYDEAIDFRTVQTGVPVTSPSATSHTTLTDRDAASSHPATAISNIPAGNITATTVQAAINELDSEKAPTSHAHAISDVTNLQTSLDGKVDENAAIVAATKTKITYDTKGLVTAGADATTADIADSTNKRYVTDAQLTALHAAVTVTDSTEIDFTLTGQDITASIKSASIDEAKLDTSVNASLDLADSSLQPGGALGTPSSGTLTNCTFPTLNQNTTGTAAIATTTTVANEATDTTCFPLFATAATGNLGPKSNANLTYNASSAILSSPNIKANYVDEVNAGNGVIIDGMQIKDNLVVGGAGAGVSNTSFDTTAGKPGGAWVAYSPTITSQTGTLTTVTVAAYWTQIGKTVNFYADIAITNNGTGATAILIPLPTTAKRAYSGYCVGKERNVTGKNITGLIDTTARIYTTYYDNSYPGGTGSNILSVSGTYEAA